MRDVKGQTTFPYIINLFQWSKENPRKLKESGNKMSVFSFQSFSQVLALLRNPLAPFVQDLFAVPGIPPEHNQC